MGKGSSFPLTTIDLIFFYVGGSDLLLSNGLKLFVGYCVTK